MNNNLTSITQIIEKELNSFLAPYNMPYRLYEPIHYTLEGGGKRLRPVLALLGTQMVGGAIEEALPAAIGLEIFHNFTLLHDDVMDNSPLRRGRASVPARYGIASAILSGDTMFTLAYKAITQVPSHKLPLVMEYFNTLSIGIMEGQQWDMEFETQDRVSMEEYMRMIHHKTAILLGGALQIGSYIGGAPQDTVEALYRVGIDMGIAFQLKDDFLDVYGDEKVFGKPIGGDIEENKKTWLYIKAEEIAMANNETDALYHAFAHKISKEAKYAAVRSLYDRYQIADRVQEEILAFSRKAEQRLLAIPQLEPTATKILQEFIHSLAQRTL